MLYVTLAFVNPGDAVLVPDPGYPTYSGVAQLTGARVLPYPLDPLHGWAPDWNALERMNIRGVKLMWTNYPHMPTGAPGGGHILDSIVAFALKHRILVCHDNPYAQLVSAGHLCSILERPEGRDVAVELHSMSKSHNLSGWRIGWAAGAADYVDAIGRVASNVESGMSLALQQAATVALQSDPSWYEQLRSEYSSRRALGARILETLGCTVAGDQAGMFVWGHITATGADAEQRADDILERMHVFLVPGTVFGKGGAGYLRLALCSPLTVLEEAAVRAAQGMQNPAWRSI
jgi:aspartate/methionine/tyrosine aminotransferase